MHNFMRGFNPPNEPGVFLVEILHDDWCKLLRGEGECNCNPEYATRKIFSPPLKAESDGVDKKDKE